MFVREASISCRSLKRRKKSARVHLNPTECKSPVERAGTLLLIGIAGLSGLGVVGSFCDPWWDGVKGARNGHTVTVYRKCTQKTWRDAKL